MPRTFEDGTFGDNCTITVKHTFINIRHAEHEDRHFMRRQSSDPSFACTTKCTTHQIGTHFKDWSSAATCDETPLEEPLTPTTTDDFVGELPQLEEPLTPNEFDVNSETTFFIGDHGDDEGRHLVAADVQYHLKVLPSWRPTVFWPEIHEVSTLLSTHQQLQPPAYAWTGDASSRIPTAVSLPRNCCQMQLQDVLDASTMANCYTEEQRVDDSLGAAHCSEALSMQLSPRRSRQAHHSDHTGSCHSIVEANGTSSSSTTLMVRNLPNDLSQPAIVEKFIRAGFAGLFDFVYMPMNFRESGNFGYTFVNFVSHETALKFMGEMMAPEYCAENWDIVWSTCQGYRANIERYRNSPLMHDSVPQECKPAVYNAAGTRVPFPAPTKSIPKPRIHWSGSKDSRSDSNFKDVYVQETYLRGSCGAAQAAKPIRERRSTRRKNAW